MFIQNLIWLTVRNITMKEYWETFWVYRVRKPIKLAKMEPKGGEQELTSEIYLWKVSQNYFIWKVLLASVMYFRKMKTVLIMFLKYPDILRSIVLLVVERATCRAWYFNDTWKNINDQIYIDLHEEVYPFQLTKIELNSSLILLWRNDHSDM